MFTKVHNILCTYLLLLTFLLILKQDKFSKTPRILVIIIININTIVLTCMMYIT